MLFYICFRYSHMSCVSSMEYNSSTKSNNTNAIQVNTNNVASEYRRNCSIYTEKNRKISLQFFYCAIYCFFIHNFTL